MDLWKIFIFSKLLNFVKQFLIHLLRYIPSTLIITTSWISAKIKNFLKIIKYVRPRFERKHYVLYQISNAFIKADELCKTKELLCYNFTNCPRNCQITEIRLIERNTFCVIFRTVNCRGGPKAEAYGRRPKFLLLRLRLRWPKV